MNPDSENGETLPLTSRETGFYPPDFSACIIYCHSFSGIPFRSNICHSQRYLKLIDCSACFARTSMYYLGPSPFGA